jgi:hypothetical protein
LADDAAGGKRHPRFNGVLKASHSLRLPANERSIKALLWRHCAKGAVMPRGDKSIYTDKQKHQAEHIEESYESRGVGEKEAERSVGQP